MAAVIGRMRIGLLMLDQMASGETPHMLLVNLAGELREKQLIALQEDHEDWAKQIITSTSDARVALEENELIFAVVVYDAPADQIVNGLLENLPPTAALVAAQDSMESLLQLSERFAGRVLLSEYPTTESGVAAFVGAIAELTGTSWRPAMLPPESDAETPRNAVHVLSAYQLLAMKYPASLANEVSSRSIPVNQGPYIPELVQAVLEDRHQLQMQKEDQRLSHAVEVAKNGTLQFQIESLENDSYLVMAQLHRTQEELEVLVFRDGNQKKMIEGFRRGRDYRKKRISELEIKLRELRDAQKSANEKIAHLERQLLSSSDKNAWLRSVRDQHRQAASELRRENGELRATLRSVQSSRSWKYTSFLRTSKGNRA